MAPSWPEEVDVFSVPHSRMKKLVHKYSHMITATDFRDEVDLTTLLKNLMNVFTEFKAHEQIENILIMRKLKNKLKAASVTSAAVCNCHSDNRLTDMLDLVEDGYRWAHKTEQERQVYGKTLMNALDVFTQNFIPHMEEEEEVFQPMLMQYFSYEELKELKAKVIYQHHISKKREEYHHEKFVEDLFKSEVSSEQVDGRQCHFSRLPNETCLQIFSLLDPRDLAKVGQVSQRFLQLSRDPSLWSRLHPVHWAMGNWTFRPESMGGVDGLGLPLTDGVEEDEQETGTCVDEDADVDESADSDTADSGDLQSQEQVLKEARLLNAIVKHLLPQVGSGVKVCDLAYSKGLSSSLVHRILKLCPNLEKLDLTHTNVGDIAFKEFGASGRQFKLRHLDLTGCENITDTTLVSLASIGRKSSELSGNDDGSVEIENVPPPCNEKLRICCSRRITCRGYVSDVDYQDLSMKFYGDGVCGNMDVATRDDYSYVSRDLLPTQGGFIMVPQENTYSCCYSGSLTGNHAQTLNMNCVNMNVQQKLDETLSSLSSSSITHTSPSDTCSTPQSSCGKKTDPSQTKPETSVSRTMVDCANTNRMESNVCTNTNHKEGQNGNLAVFDADVSGSRLEFLSLNGCYRISDRGLSALAEGLGTPRLHHLDLSGCVSVTALGLSRLVSTSHCLDHANLFYCDNMSDDPFFTTASGCRNLQCETRFCCSIRE